VGQHCVSLPGHKESPSGQPPVPVELEQVSFERSQVSPTGQHWVLLPSHKPSPDGQPPPVPPPPPDRQVSLERSQVSPVGQHWVLLPSHKLSPSGHPPPEFPELTQVSLDKSQVSPSGQQWMSSEQIEYPGSQVAWADAGCAPTNQTAKQSSTAVPKERLGLNHWQLTVIFFTTALFWLGP